MNNIIDIIQIYLFLKQGCINFFLLWDIKKTFIFLCIIKKFHWPYSILQNIKFMLPYVIQIWLNRLTI